MRVTLLTAPWYEGQPTQALLEACDILGDGTWRDAAVGFYAERAARIRPRFRPRAPGSRALRGWFGFPFWSPSPS